MITPTEQRVEDTPERVEAIQADRDAAAAYIRQMLGAHADGFASRVRDGHADDEPIVQAFARHRLAHERRPSPEVSEERALIDALCDFALGRVNLSMTAELRARIEALHTRAHPDTPAASSVDASGAVEAIARYVEGHGGVIPGTAVFAPLISGNNQPCMSGDGRDRLLPHKRRLFDDATSELAAAIRALPFLQPKDSDHER
jgi:hypothetical protein